MAQGVKVSPEREGKIIKMCLGGYSSTKAAERFGVSPSTVRLILKRNGIPRRDGK